MKQIIQDKLYDTKKAKWIGEQSSGLPSDFSYLEETLYRTARGNWFIHGKGGPMSIYSEHCSDNSYTGSEQLIALSEDQAYAWIVQHCDPDTVFEYFGYRIEEA